MSRQRVQDSFPPIQSPYGRLPTHFSPFFAIYTSLIPPKNPLLSTQHTRKALFWLLKTQGRPCSVFSKHKTGPVVCCENTRHLCLFQTHTMCVLKTHKEFPYLDFGSIPIPLGHRYSFVNHPSWSHRIYEGPRTSRKRPFPSFQASSPNSVRSNIFSQKQISLFL